MDPLIVTNHKPKMLGSGLRILTPVSSPSDCPTVSNTDAHQVRSGKTVLPLRVDLCSTPKDSVNLPTPLTPPIEEKTEDKLPNPYIGINCLTKVADVDRDDNSLEEEFDKSPLLVSTLSDAKVPGTWAKPSGRFRKTEGRITFICKKQNYGIIEFEVFFQLNIVFEQKLKIGTIVNYEAIKISDRLFEWNAYKVEAKSLAIPQTRKRACPFESSSTVVKLTKSEVLVSSLRIRVHIL
ncbi:hypothetical protein M3Y98_00642200 [Aphelenchoides besseyi]|nr:hypothetical protein M3Y98_00642200 [Aphelenchoides besseyi]KAI6208581.1 hypothetical protein M3Y96_00130300 [Aphelenchoides besseyi]